MSAKRKPITLDTSSPSGGNIFHQLNKSESPLLIIALKKISAARCLDVCMRKHLDGYYPCFTSSNSKNLVQLGRIKFIHSQEAGFGIFPQVSSIKCVDAKPGVCRQLVRTNRVTTEMEMRNRMMRCFLWRPMPCRDNLNSGTVRTTLIV